MFCVIGRTKDTHWPVYCYIPLESRRPQYSHFSSVFMSKCCIRLKRPITVSVKLFWVGATLSVFSEKQASTIPDELFDAAAHQGVTTVNFSKNQLTSIPSRYTHTHTATLGACGFTYFIAVWWFEHHKLLVCCLCRLVEFQSSVSDINLGFNRLTCCSPHVSNLLQLTHIDFRYTHTDTVYFIWVVCMCF